MNLRFKILFSLFLFFLSEAIAFSQDAKITGKVYDFQTREALPFVNIKYKGGKPFTTSDVDGNFSITAEGPSDSLEVSYIGYKTKKVKIKRNVSQTLNISIEPDVLSLKEVVILPGENPAHRILRKVIAHKPEHNRDKLLSYEYEVYNKIEFDLNNIPPKIKEKKILKPIKFVFDYIDSTSITEKPFLPLLLSEALSNYYWKKSPRFKKEIIKASKISGMQDKSMTQFMGEMYQNVNIYDNDILVFGKQFPSPISDHALLYYKFYLIDSLYLDNHRCYQLQFKPKWKQELCFTGNMWVADTSFAVKRLEMSLPNDINLNFVKTLGVVQEYTVADSMWMLSRDRLIVDFKLDEYRKKSLTAGFYGRKTTSYTNIVINKPRPDDFYSRMENIIVLDSADKHTDEFWKQNRHDTLSKNEKQIYKMVDTIKSLPIYQSYYNWIYFLANTYKPWGYVEIGPYHKIYSKNVVEGNRFRLGGRTSDKFSKWVELSGYGAYGTLDKQFKYSTTFRTYITKKPRQILSLGYKDDVEVLGQSPNAFTPDNILTTIFRRRPLSSLTKVQQALTSYEFEPHQGLNMKFFFINRVMTPLGGFTYQYHIDDTTLGTQNNIISSELQALIRFAYNEKYIEYTFSRASMGTRYPVVTLLYTYGMKGIFQSNYEYHKLSLNINDRFRINPLVGYTDYIVEAGKIFGTVPYPLLTLHGGNETIIYDPYAYNMMNYYEFASDQYVTAQVFHHFEGFFLNHIPIMRRLKWREVVSAKWLVGSISEKNQNVFVFPSTLTSLNQGPYYEVSAGVENIFRFFRIDVLWRLSYIDKNYVSFYTAASGDKKVPIVGVRGSLQINF
ncbi:MAG: carboxypeptidase-like regulatory domain-containing protein [Bacteroidetes bacterium]|nr:carboxypeptidase-like regulatory domain-containing protein [Bacteroidota bacterium]